MYTINNQSSRNLKRQLLFMWLYVFVLYIPFYFIMLERHSVNYISLSVIGWFTGGLHYIALFMLLTLPFGLYMLFYLNKHLLGNFRWINIAGVISCVFMTIGGFIPLGMGDFLYYAHVITSISSSVVFMLTLFIALLMCAWRSKNKWLFLALCGLHAIAQVIGFILLYTSALYQLTVTLSYMLIFLVVNTVSICRLLKNNTSIESKIQ